MPGKKYDPLVLVVNPIDVQVFFNELTTSGIFDKKVKKQQSE